jgi:hypothetical protein
LTSLYVGYSIGTENEKERGMKMENMNAGSKPKAEMLKTVGTCAICDGTAYAGLRVNRKIVPICGACVGQYLKDAAREAFEALQIPA